VLNAFKAPVLFATLGVFQQTSYPKHLGPRGDIRVSLKVSISLLSAQTGFALILFSLSFIQETHRAHHSKP